MTIEEKILKLQCEYRQEMRYQNNQSSLKRSYAKADEINRQLRELWEQKKLQKNSPTIFSGQMD